MKFGSWTYKLDALNIKVNKTGQLTPKATTGEIDDGFSSDLFEKNGVILLNSFLSLIVDGNTNDNGMHDFLTGMGNTWRSSNSD